MTTEPGRGDGASDPVRQRTLKSSIHCAGTGLHSGASVAMTLHPAAADSGVVFRRTDIAGGNAVIRASWRNIADKPMCTALTDGSGVTVATVEHLLAALAGCAIDNLTVELNGPEVPAMDGSAWPFVFLVGCAGIVELDAPRRAIRILKPVAVGDGQRRAALTPGPGFVLDFAIAYETPAIGRQALSIHLGEGVFAAALARARTYGFLHEVEELRAAGLARGASLDNAVVIGGERVLNEGGLRYPDEFVRHKLVDAIGDLSLAGGPLIGHFHGQGSGHRMNHRLLRALFADAGAWRGCALSAADAAAAPRDGAAATA